MMTSTAENQHELLTIQEAAHILRVPATWLYSATKRGQFPCVRNGRYVRIRRSDVTEWIASGGKAPGS
jgi:excisionase family DNA binding protein